MIRAVAGSGFALILLVGSAADLAAVDDCAPIVRSGIWEFDAPGRVSTALGEMKTNSETGGGPIRSSCEEKTITMFPPSGGPLVYRHAPIAFARNRFEAEPMTFTDGGYEQTFYMALFVDSPTEFEVAISTQKDNWSHARRIHYSFAEVETANRDECECPQKLDEFIKERIADNQHWVNLYGNQAYWQEPQDFPDDVAWDGYAYELLIGYVDAGSAYATAVAQVVNQRRGEETGDEDPTAGAEAYTDDKTCQIHPGPSALDLCFPDLADEETWFHEVLHSQRCFDMRERRQEALANLSSDAPPSFGMLMATISEAAREEVRAYRETINWLRNWKAENCD